jgi:hypothetical protein
MHAETRLKMQRSMNCFDLLSACRRVWLLENIRKSPRTFVEIVTVGKLENAGKMSMWKMCK